MKNFISCVLFILLLLPSLSFAAPAIPDNLELEASSSTIKVTWTANTNTENDSYDDTDGYYIYYRKTNDTSIEWRVELEGVEKDNFTITGLEANIQYTVKITAYSGDSESTSDTETITTNSLEIDIAITGTDRITVSIDAENSDIETYSVEVGTIVGSSDVFSKASIDKDDSQVVTGLSTGIYYIRVTLSNKTVLSETFSFEDTHTFLSSSGDIEDGCFINSSDNNSFFKIFIISSFSLIFLFFLVKAKRWKISISFLILLLCLSSTDCLADEDLFYKNVFGLKGGWFIADESEQKDVYEKIVPFSFFYERMLTDYFSADIDLGYSKSDGTAVATSSASTELETELEMYPAAISLNIHCNITSVTAVYFGVGGDWWMVEEKSPLGEFKSEVGGWHAKTGVKIFSDELETFKKIGFLIEASYSQINRFGNNDIDLGGWKFNAGLMYCM